MNKLYIKDQITVQSVPDTQSIKKEFVQIKDSEERQYLEVTVDATHCGYFNHNNYYYTQEGMARGVGSWLQPYAKPALANHDVDTVAIGRVAAAAFIPVMQSKRPNSEASEKISDLRGTPSGKIRLRILVTDKEAINHILDQRFFTVSTGGSPSSTPLCSICKEPIDSTFGLNFSCEHHAGKIYDGKLCGLMIGEMDYKEVSFVNTPADYSPDHVAGVVDMRLVSESTASGTYINLSEEIKPEDSKIHDNETIKKEESMDDNKEKLVTCEACKKVFDYAKEPEVAMGAVKCPHCKVTVDQTGKKLADIEDVKKAEYNASSGDKTSDDKTSTEDNKIAQIDEAELKLRELDVEDLVCPDCENWDDADDNLKQEAESLAMDYDSFVSVSIGNSAEDEEWKEDAEDAKLPSVGSKARKEMKTTFCGPNKTFPIPDCKHATIAMAMLNFPNVKKKYSSSVRAKIASCVKARAKTLNCPMAKKKDSESIIAKLDEANKKANDSVTVLAEITAQLEKANDKIADMTKDARTALAEKYLDLSIIMKRDSVKDIINGATKEEKDTLYQAKLLELAGRTSDSLRDSITDLKSDVVPRGKEQIENPVVDDFQQVLQNKKSRKLDRVKKVRILFGLDDEK